MTKDEALLAYTGRDSRHWFDVVQGLIRRYFEADPGNPHPACDVVEWMSDLVRIVAETHGAWVSRPRRFERLRRPRPAYDGNLSTAYIVAIVLTTWSIRLSRAKAHDPVRPIRLRRRASAQNRHLAAALFDALYDESHDAGYLPGQAWEYPWQPGATDGDFV